MMMVVVELELELGLELELELTPVYTKLNSFMLIILLFCACVLVSSIYMMAKSRRGKTKLFVFLLLDILM